MVQRGSITCWRSDDFEKLWLYHGEKQRGSQFDYSDPGIRTMLTSKEVFQLPNRGVKGCVRSIFEMRHLDLPVPDHATLCKRGKPVKVTLPKKTHDRLTIGLDSAGLKIYGEEEWQVRQHGISKRRTGRKLHIGTNPDDGEIQAVLLTTKSVRHATAIAPLLAQIPQPIGDFAADGAADKRKV